MFSGESEVYCAAAEDGMVFTIRLKLMISLTVISERLKVRVFSGQETKMWLWRINRKSKEVHIILVG